MGSRSTGWWRPAVTVVVAAIVPAVVASAPAADSFDDWVRAQAAAARRATPSLESYKTAQDAEFAQFLGAQWRDYKAFEALTRDPVPKPQEPPQAPPARLDVPPPGPGPRLQPSPSPSDVPAKRPRPEYIPQVPAVPLLPSLPPPMLQPGVPPQPVMVLDFFGQSFEVPYDARWQSPIAQGVGARDAARFWEVMSGTRHKPTVLWMDKMDRVLALDDWGRVLLWQEFARAMRPDSPGDQLMLVWFFLIQSGIDVRLGYNGNDVVLLPAVRQEVYGARFITVDGQRYYALLTRRGASALDNVSSHERRYPGKLRALDIRAAATTFVRSPPETRRLAFEFEGRQVTVDVTFDRQVLAFLGRFPQLDFDLYFRSDPGYEASRSLLDALRPHVEKMDDEKAVDFLLAFVQKAFAYKTDADQFGYEKYFFAEEVLFYPYSDCEDRAVLFSWLVRHLLQLKTVGLHYPGHMTTAVAMKSIRPAWKTVEWSGVRYVIADPTYVNAKIGQAMPSYEKLAPLHVIDPVQP